MLFAPKLTQTPLTTLSPICADMSGTTPVAARTDEGHWAAWQRPPCILAFDPETSSGEERLQAASLVTEEKW